MTAAPHGSSPAHRLSGGARVWLLVSAITGGALVVWAIALSRYPPTEALAASELPWSAFVVGFFLTEAYAVHVHFRRQAHTLSMTEIAVVVALFHASPLALLVGQLLGAGLAFGWARRQRAVKLAFNVAQLTLATGLTLLVFRSLLGGAGLDGAHGWAATFAGAAASSLLGVLLVAVVIRLADGGWPARLAGTTAFALLSTLATASLALAAVELLRHDAAAVTLLALPLVLSALAFRAYMEQRQERERMQFLYESMRATQEAPELGLAIGELLLSARRLLRAEYAEILLPPPRPGEDGMRSTSGADGEMLMRPTPIGPVEEAAIAFAASEQGAVLLPQGRRRPHALDGLLAARGLRDAIVGVLHGEERAFGVLLVGDRAGDVATFVPEDLSLFETFAGHASVILENTRLERTLAQVTELKEELHHQAYHDALTGLPNRVFFAQQVGEALRAREPGAERPALLFLDLDGFKLVNDTWGHSTGDELLVHVAERLRGTLRPGDSPARLGGDEFAVLLTGADADGARRAAERIVVALDAPFAVAGREIAVHASIGIAVAGVHAASADELLRNADVAMYTAKADPGSRFALYEPSLHALMRERRELALDLEQAVGRGEIVVHYQPVVSLRDGRVAAFEALARWRHPQRGIVMPSEFVALAEESGLMVEVGRHVLERACTDAAAWGPASPGGAAPKLWVNLSPSELASERLVDDIALTIARAGLAAERLTLEVTESTVIRDELGAARTMHQLRGLGVRISIDDFGTGYSSLSRLGEFAIDMLKIPKPFVDRLVGPEADVSFVDAILRLASSLGLETVAEGVQVEEQVHRLSALGCAYAQGFLLGRPVSAVEAADLLDAPSPLPARVA